MTKNAPESPPAQDGIASERAVSGTESETPKLGGSVPLAKMPAHWMLGRLGKKVMRPGGLAPSLRMLDALAITSEDDVIDMWPGLGVTTQHALSAHPRSYTAIERGKAERARVQKVLSEPNQYCIVTPTHRTGLDDNSASVIYGEALLTLEPAKRKTATVAEAVRLLRPGGRYGIHELLLTPTSLTESAKDEIETVLTKVLHVLARPLTRDEWRALVETHGFEVTSEESGKLVLLDIPTFLSDEGVLGTAAFLGRSLAHPSVLPRLATIWKTFHRYRDNLGSIVLTARHG